jgi:DNA polymerase III subunit gamma/tau
MSYLVFARKYRPLDFSQVVGQESVVSTLQKSLKNDRVHHAYLFSGPRGIGKTSMARILAKCLNCLSSDEPTLNPCGKCANCLEISKGNSLDVIEIDGASNRGIDEIRQLRENVRFSPSNSRFKIYIIDEVHQITHDAFNALLKTLEEPPSHVKFIFATTNPDKVPLTILSRCQKLQFGLLSNDKITQKLKYIAEQEEIKVTEDLFKYIARASFGSIRDAESIFDQVVPLIVEGIELENILDLLGQSPEHKIAGFIENLLDRETTPAIMVISEIIEQGRDLDNFLTTAIEYLRNVMLAKLGESFLVKVSVLPPELCKQFKSLSDKVTMNFLLGLVDEFIKAKRLAKFLPSLRIPLELAVIKSTYQDQTSKIDNSCNRYHSEEGTKGESTSPGKNKTGFNHKTAALNLESVSKVFDSLKKKKKPKHESLAGEDQEKKEEVTVGESLDMDKVKDNWEKVIDNISKERMAVATYLREAYLVKTDGIMLYLGFPKNLSFHKECLNTNEYKQLLQQELERVLGCKVGVIYILLDCEKKIQDNNNSKNIVKHIKDEFSGEIII